MMPPQPVGSEAASLGRLLYVSALAAGVPVTEVSRIVAASRSRNALDALTGVLAFDGESFCQYVEGPLEAVESLLLRLRRDPRHTDMDVLVEGPFGGARRFRNWRLGYADASGEDELSALRRLRGGKALACFEQLVPRLDVEA